MYECEKVKTLWERLTKLEKSLKPGGVVHLYTQAELDAARAEGYEAGKRDGYNLAEWADCGIVGKRDTSLPAEVVAVVEAAVAWQADYMHRPPIDDRGAASRIALGEAVEALAAKRARLAKGGE